MHSISGVHNEWAPTAVVERNRGGPVQHYANDNLQHRMAQSVVERASECLPEEVLEGEEYSEDELAGEVRKCAGI